MIRHALVAFALMLAVVVAVARPAPTRTSGFDVFLAELWSDAKVQGITRETFDLAFAGVTPDPRVIAATKRQPEYNQPAGDYVNALASSARAAAGRKKETQWHATLDAIEAKFKVERSIVLALWGLETSYGVMKDKWDVVRSLATLAEAKYRDPFFRDELLAALRILQDGHIARDKFLGSWAGAMGQPQFMPSTFINHAVDFDGDRRRDIWTSVPDVLASIANYLSRSGWQLGTPWGFEVTVPKDFDYRRSHASFAEWTTLGVVRADGRPYPAAGNAILFFPAGVPGPGFVVTANFDAIKAYNDSDVYALAVGHLADLMNGGGPFRTTWPRQATQRPRGDRILLQRKLAALGYDQTRFSGHLDFKMRDFIRAEQVKHGLRPDGHPDLTLLRRMGIKRP